MQELVDQRDKRAPKDYYIFSRHKLGKTPPSVIVLGPDALGLHHIFIHALMSYDQCWEERICFFRQKEQKQVILDIKRSYVIELELSHNICYFFSSTALQTPTLCISLTPKKTVQIDHKPYPGSQVTHHHGPRAPRHLALWGLELHGTGCSHPRSLGWRPRYPRPLHQA